MRFAEQSPPAEEATIWNTVYATPGTDPRKMQRRRAASARRFGLGAATPENSGKRDASPSESVAGSLGSSEGSSSSSR